MVCFIVRYGSISAFTAYDLKFFAVVDGDVITEEITEGEMVYAVKLELPAFQFLKELSQRVSVFIVFSLLLGHRHFLWPETKKPSGFLPRARIASG